MYSTGGGIRDLMLCYIVLFFSNEREDISSLTYSYAGGRKEGLGWLFAVVVFHPFQ